MGPPTRTDVAGGFYFEPLRRESLDPHGYPGLRIARAEVLTDTGDEIPPPREAAPPHCMKGRGFDRTVLRFAFSPEPETVDVAADPAGVLEIDAAAVTALPLQLIEKHEPVDWPVVYRVPFKALRECCGPVGVRHGGDRLFWLVLRLLRRRRHVSGVILYRFRHRRRWLRRLLPPGQDGGCHQHRKDIHSSTLTSRNMPDSMWYRR